MSESEPKTSILHDNQNGVLPPTTSSNAEYSDEADLERDAEPANLSKVDTAKSIAEMMPLPKEILFVGVVCSANFTSQVGLTSCLIILHSIGDTFGLTNPAELSWLIAAYSLTVGTFILLAGRLGDVYGYKKILILGFSWFALWSMVAGLAVFSNHVLFDFARVFQGMGPAMCIPNALAILGATYQPGPRKAMVFALFGAAAPIGALVGAVFAAIFNLAWWPWAFWALAIALAGLAILGSFVIPDPPTKTPKNLTLREKLVELDLLGGLCGITALVLFNFAWNQSGVVGWQKAYVYVCLILGTLIAPLFFYIELHVAPNPLIPFDALSSDVAFVLGCIACGWSCFGIWVYYTWQFWEVLRGASPLLACAWLSPIAISGGMAGVTTGILINHLRPAWLMTISLVAFTVGTILIATAPIHQSYWAQAFVCTLVIPWGMDMSFPAATLIMSNAVSKEHQGVAASLVNTIVNYSISLGLGIAGTVEGHVNRGGKNPQDLLLGYRGAWYMGIGLSSFGLFLSLVFLAKGYWRDRTQRIGGANEKGAGDGGRV